jgi:hypothetical protein
MRNSKTKHTLWRPFAAALFCSAVTLLTGCQVEYAGQTLPSPYYLTDDIQYYAPGPEFKLAREAAAMQEQREAIESEQQEALGN